MVSFNICTSTILSNVFIQVGCPSNYGCTRVAQIDLFEAEDAGDKTDL